MPLSRSRRHGRWASMGIALAMILTAALVAASCGNPHPAPGPSVATTATAPDASPATPTSAATPAATATPAAAASSPAPAGAPPANPPAMPSPPGAAGPLSIASTTPFPGGAANTANGEPLVVAEGPDGTVFAADPSANPEVVYAFAGSGPPVAVVHPAHPVSALAADTNFLYVATANQVTSFDRTTHRELRAWPVGAESSSGSPGTTFAVAFGKLWLLGGTGATPSLDEIDPASTSVTVLVEDATNVAGFAVGTTGIYYVGDSGATLVAISATGAQVSAPTRIAINTELSGPASVEAMAVSNGQVLLAHEAGQGLDADVATYDATNLAGPQVDAATTVSNLPIVATSGGLLEVVVANTEQGAGCPTTVSEQTSRLCLARAALPSGTPDATSGAPPVTNTSLLALPGQEDSQLAGPYPAIFVTTSSTVDFLRFS